jgi:hypothetical protein
MFSFKQFFLEQRIIGEGGNRKVYSDGEGRVLKIAKNKTGILQNKEEANPKYHQYNAIAKVFNYDPEYKWVKSERANPIGPNRLRQLFGINDIGDLKTYFLVKKAGNINLSAKMIKLVNLLDNNNNVQEIVKLVFDNNLVIADVCRLSSLGELQRDGKPYIVLVDYGLNEQEFATHYKPNRIARKKMYGY